MILTLVASPLIIWGLWDMLENAPSTALKVALCAAIIVVTYIGLGLLLMWNRYIQEIHRNRDTIEQSTGSPTS